MARNFSYDQDSDSLIVSNKQENEIVKDNFEAGDMVFSLTGKGKIVSIEIREFSVFLENCNISPLILDNLQDIELKIVPKKDSLFILLGLKSSDKSVVLSKNIPLVVPLVR